MNRKLKLLAVSLLALTVYAEVDPSTVTFTVNSSNLSPGDRRTAKFIVRQENKIRLNNGQSALPIGSNADVKSSLETALTAYLTRFMIDSADRADREADEALSPEDKRTVLRAVSDQLNSGKTPAQIEAAIKAIP